MHDDGTIQAANGPRVAELCPVIGGFHLTAFFVKGLLEQAVLVSETITGQRYVDGDGGVQEARSQAAQAAIAEGVILDILQDGDVHAALSQQRAHLIQVPQAEQVVVHHAAHQILRRHIVRLALPGTGFLAGSPGGGERQHGGGGDGVVQLGGGGLFQRHMVVHHQQGLGLLKQFTGIHHKRDYLQLFTG